MVVCYLTGVFIFPDYKSIFMSTMLQAIASNFYWPSQGRSLAPPTITTPLAIGWALAWQLITVHFGFSAACALHTSVHANTRMCGQLVCVSIVYTLWKVVWPKPDQPDHLLWPCVMIVHVHTIYVYMYYLICHHTGWLVCTEKGSQWGSHWSCCGVSEGKSQFGPTR